MSARIACIVPFCGRTAPAEKYAGCEIICAKHWRMISRQTRAFKASAERRHRKFLRRRKMALAQGDLARQLVLARALDRTHAACLRAWNDCRREAIEAAMGIA